MGAPHEPLTLPEPAPAPDVGRDDRPADSLGAWDAVSIVVGIVVGVGIFEAPAKVFAAAPGPASALAAWVLGGLLSLAGALCFAELASAFPRSGGEYVYLTRAFGRPAGFLFAWSQLAVIRTAGTVALPAYIFATNADRLADLGREGAIALAVLAILALTAVNVLGVNPGRRTQNLLTLLKVLGVGGVILAGFLAPAPAAATAPVEPIGTGSLAVAMVFILYAYSGWHEAAYVTAEVRRPRRNVPLALLGGTVLVTLLYVLFNAAFLAGLSFEAARRPSTAASADLLTATLGPPGGRLMAGLVMLSALGTLNGCVFTGARIYREWGADHPLFAPLAVRSPRWGTPVRALVLQAAVSCAIVTAAGLARGAGDPFETLVKGTAPVFWLSFLLTGASLFVFRSRGVRPPFSVPLYPLVPLLFCGWCAFMLAASLADSRLEALVGLGVLAAGVPLALLSRHLEKRAESR
jgi:amino acid transporter